MNSVVGYYPYKEIKGTMSNMNAKQLTLFNMQTDNSEWRVKNFSADNCCDELARQELESKFISITEVTDKFNRQSVSYQLSKKDCLHRWLKYKEGFSAELVEELINDLGIKQGDILLDPFLGSGTTCLVAQMNGIDSIGFDIMPMSTVAMYAKGNIVRYDTDELTSFIQFLYKVERPKSYKKRAASITITSGAYPEDTEYDIPFFTEQIKNSSFSEEAKGLAVLCLLNSLERLSYTAKDGQYLRWDIRSRKVIKANAARIASGREPLKVKLNKGELPSVQDVLIEELEKAIKDIVYLQNNITTFSKTTKMQFKQSSSLFELPLLDGNSIGGVITSPPYCNRYDYTRIYALELVYLGMGEDEIRKTRQDLLSCTVESKDKIDYLRDYYTSIGKITDYNNVLEIIQRNKALKEVLAALEIRNDRGDINNKGVLKMVKGYFEELAFIYYELYRICKEGAGVAFVNDNVRYAGEVIPVDFISTELAEQFGFTPVKIYTLRQQKGNSSQQMAKFGRVPLRKSITIWKK